MIFPTLDRINKECEPPVVIFQGVLDTKAIGGCSTAEDFLVILIDRSIVVEVDHPIGPQIVAIGYFIIDLPFSFHPVIIAGVDGLADKQALGNQIIFPAVMIQVKSE